ncbi:MAG: flagellar hook-associated protein FlgK [Candidatus Aureabacteria bacterium]|nr:flagellar hook-associated protein FlgK [Candidatus Auribacterota bacterium]
MSFEQLSLGTEAMRAAQGALGVIGHNIANINTEGYTRQRAVLVTNPPQDYSPGQRGTGVHIDAIKRLTDEFTRLQIEEENQKAGQYEIYTKLMEQIEQVLNEPTDTGLQTAISDFFNSFHTLANTPEDYGARSVVLGKAQGLVTKLNSLSRQMQAIQNEVDQVIRIKVDEINSLTERIAVLNDKIASVEAGGIQNANDLRDSRELLVKQLNKILDVTSFEDENKNLLIEAQGAVLVAGTRSIPLSAVSDANGHLVPANANSGVPIVVTGGELKGLLDARDTMIGQTLDKLDTLASTLIEEVNRLHTQGTTLSGHLTAQGDVVVSQPAVIMALLTDNDVTYPVQAGTFYITTYDQVTGAVVDEQAITVDPATQSLNDIINSVTLAFSGTGSLTAGLTGDNRLQFTAGAGCQFEFIQDSTENTDDSDFLLAFGVNTFFSGNSAYSIALKDSVTADPDTITAGKSASPGDNRNALLIYALQNERLLNSGTTTLTDYYASIVSEAGTESQTAKRNEETQTALMLMLEQRMASSTGVSLDEEAANMLIFQRMFQAAAKYISAMDTVLDTLINGL